MTLLFVILAVFEPGSRFLFDTARCSSPVRFTNNDSRITINRTGRAARGERRGGKPKGKTNLDLRDKPEDDVPFVTGSPSTPSGALFSCPIHE
jgi:hypothetical protein